MSDASSSGSHAALKRTPFFDFHVAHGARLVDFGGWHMPIQYQGLLPEHMACRGSVGLFDVSHMGEVRVHGRRALEAVRGLVTNSMDIALGQAQYSPMCQPDGGIVDDLIVYNLADDDVLVCVNASNKDKDFAWMVEHNPLKGQVVFEDQSSAYAQVAIQGRNAVATLQKLTAVDLSAIPYYWVGQGTVAGVKGCILARTGYTGEDGFEVFLPEAGARAMWPAIVEAGRGFAEGDLAPIGLGARDTLRLEARMCLYGNDISDKTTPLEANLGWTVKLDKADFVGRDALLRQRDAGVPRRLVGLLLDGRIPRPHCPVLHQGQVVGEVTSGTRSPSTGQDIALAYVPSALSKPGTSLQVDVRGKLADARVHKGPFYQRPY